MASILVVDDDESIRFLVREDLTLEGHTVSTAADGPSGLKAVEADLPDVVILDIKMPGMGGLEVLRLLKALHPELKVIMFTAFGDYREEAMELGADGYFVKSANLAPLKEIIGQLQICH